MSAEFKVYVVDYGRKNLVLRYRDPVNGRQVTKSAKTPDYKAATKAAAKWEMELSAGQGSSARMSWNDFRDRFEAEHLAGLAPDSITAYNMSLGAFSRVTGVQRIRSVDSQLLASFAAARRRNVAEETVRKDLRHIRAAIRWAVRQGILQRLPEFPTARRAKGVRHMKGRPITGEEFERCLRVIPEIVGEEQAPAWRFLWQGMYWGSLRLDEALRLYWSDAPHEVEALVVDISGKYPVFVIPAGGEKGNSDRVLPIAPEFVEILQQVPPRQRRGRVFPVRGPRCVPKRLSDHASRVNKAIGQKAGVIVDRTKSGKVKYATAHDLRRAFGTRWATRVMPAVLQQMMRHADIGTTMRYYVGLSAQQAAATIWDAMPKKKQEGNILGSTPTQSDEKQKPKRKRKVRRKKKLGE